MDCQPLLQQLLANVAQSLEETAGDKEQELQKRENGDRPDVLIPTAARAIDGSMYLSAVPMVPAGNEPGSIHVIRVPGL